MKYFLAVAVAALLMTCTKSPTGPENSAGQSFTLTSTTQASQAGLVIRLPDKDSFEWGDTVRLIAVPSAGYSFSGWSGDFGAPGDTLVVVMVKNTTVYADFVNVNTGRKAFSVCPVAENGSVVMLPAGGVYDSGSVISVMAAPEYGMKFSGWSGLLTGTDSVAFLVVSQNGILRANFILDSNAVFATLRISPAPANGKIVLDPAGVKSGNGYKFKPGTSVTISAVPGSGFELTAWGGDFAAFSASDTSFTAVMDSDRTVNAMFTKAPDGVVWTSRTSGNGNGLLGVASNGSLIVVVGNSGSILTSPDGITWTNRTSGVTPCLNSVIWARGLFVCVGDDGTVLTSSDGVTWAVKNSSTTYGLESVVWTGPSTGSGTGWFVAVGGQFVNSGLNYNCVVTSPDGNIWTTQSGGIGIWYGLAWNGSRIVATGYDYDFTTVSDNSMSVMYTSPDGSSWTMGGNDISQLASLNSIVWSGTQFVAVGGSRDATYPSSSIYFSQNGDTWTEASAATESMFNGVTWTGNNYVAVGDNGVVATSDAALSNLTWTIRTSGTTHAIYSVTWVGNQCVAVGYGGMILTSP